MTTKIILFSALLFCSNAAQACYNGYHIVKGEMRPDFSPRDFIFGAQHLSGNDYREALGEAKKRYKKNKSTENYSDYGLSLCYTGEYATAMKIFQEIEQKAPNKYQTAANIGTTYELLGKLDSALFWIKRSLEINPNSHGGSEWIHVKILEHEIAAKGDAKYSLTHSILGLSQPVNRVDSLLEKHLLHQLTERMLFVKPKNTVVGQLLFEYAKFQPKRYRPIVYKRAIEYGYSNKIMEDELGIKQTQAKIAEENGVVFNYNFYYLLSALLSALAFCGIIAFQTTLYTKY